LTNSIHPDTTIGTVSLTVSDLDRSLAWYQEALGFSVHRNGDGVAHLGAGGADLVELVEQPGARQVTGTTGLYHFAVLVPSRLALALSLKRIAVTQTPVQGFADHGVSEAIYLSDPDGNGIEIYRDLPRENWPVKNGQLQMVTDPLDLDDLLSEVDNGNGSSNGLNAATAIGHIHLHVADIPQTEAFYHDLIGFDLMQRFGGSATFLSAGGYHHHLGGNTWAGVNAPPPPQDAVGLRWYTINLPNQEALQPITDRLHTAGIAIQERDQGLFVRDPSGNGVVLAVG
jgi:catechol 2,3-dioxygenase